MKNITLRGVDEELEKVLKQKAKSEHTSMNKLVLRILRRNLLDKKDSIEFKTYHDLDHLAGSWTEEEAREFEEHISPFGQIDEEMWK